MLNRSLRLFIAYAGLVLAISVPVYYGAISALWQYELDEHNIVLTPEAGREDKFLIIGAVTLLTLLFFMILLAVLVWVNRRVSKKLWQPFYRSIDVIKEFDLNGQPEVHFGQTDITEFATLNEELHKLIESSIAAYNQQKEFADHASHELQTPLAIARSKMELLLQRGDLQEAHYELIEEALSALSRVSRINKNLLLLTKIENNQYLSKEMIRFSELTEEAVLLLQDYAGGKHLELEYDIAPAITVLANKVLAEILLHNLLMNAIAYSPAGSRIWVRLAGGQLTISNPGVAALNGERIFKRFAAVSAQTPGTGLGLSIAEKIASASRWKIQYAFDGKCHHFSILF